MLSNFISSDCWHELHLKYNVIQLNLNSITIKWFANIPIYTGEKNTTQEAFKIFFRGRVAQD